MNRSVFLVSLFLTTLAVACGSSSPDEVGEQVGAPIPTLIVERESGVPELTPEWRVGQSWEFELVKTRQRSTSGVLTSDASSTSVVLIEVLEANENGFLIGYTLKSIDIPSSGSAEGDALVRDLAEVTVDLTFEVIVGKDAVIEGIKNLIEISAAVNTAIEKVIEIFAIHSTPAELASIEAVYDQVRDTFTSEEGIITSSLPELNLLLLPFGWDMTVGELYEVDNVLPNPLGGPPIDAVAIVELTDLVPGDNRYTFSWTQILAGPQAEQSIIESIRNLAEATGNDLEGFDAQTVVGLERRDNGRFELDLSDWTVLELEFTEETRIQDQSRLNSTRMRLLK